MADAVVIKPSVAPAAVTVERAEPIPWYLWTGLLATTSAVLGGHWDISWHRSIGRDTFWTPAHIAIYFGGVLAGFSSAWVVLTTTFRKTPGAASVRLWGFRGPLGTFMCIWGALAMITSAPFDNWWHSAYGLDVKILSPPHFVLALGFYAIAFGALIQVLGQMNRVASGPEEDARRLRVLEWMFLYCAGMMLTMLQTVIWEYTFRVNMHQSQFYRVSVPVSLMLLAGVARVCPHRWSATIAASIYSLLLILLILILPLFPAEPKLGPVYQQVQFFIPPEFPLLLIFPALALDWLVKRLEGLNRWALAAVAGAAFLLVFVCVQWPFADFLMSPASRNWFFGTHYMPYFASPNGFYARHLFFPPELQPDFLLGMGAALLLAVLATRFSLAWGDWMRKIQR